MFSLLISSYTSSGRYKLFCYIYVTIKNSVLASFHQAQKTYMLTKQFNCFFFKLYGSWTNLAIIDNLTDATEKLNLGETIFYIIQMTS